ncbi:MAG: hypothetical protein WKF30_16185 [Pyrinomonadaceae bacterium]
MSDDRSRYVSFLHPWGDLRRDPLILALMFIALVGATLVTLRIQDLR